MEKTYTRAPFNLELANKIKSGKVEGRIVNITTEEVSYTKYGSVLTDTHKDTFIELPEEFVDITTNNDWYKAEDIKEKIEYVASKMGLTYEQFIIAMDSLKGIIKINGDMIHLLDDMKDDMDRICETPICNNPDSPICKVCSNFHCNDCQYNTPKHEFKPFDKVLVREQSTDEWKCDYFSHTQNDGVCTYYVCIGGEFLKCISYEGNEHLVGKTDKPKEE